jgi:ElaB/YqjD/DUF883 family membrane-anchored ribosome-binding protein
MTLKDSSLPLVNWPLFTFISLIIILRAYLPSICLWFINRFYSSSKIIDQLTNELKRVQNELKTISQQDEFAAYARKERERSKLVQQLKDQRNEIETKQKNIVTYIQLILNIGTVVIMIYFTITGRRHESIPLFNFPFFRFPLIVWIMALHTFITNIVSIYSRYQTSKKSTD